MPDLAVVVVAYHGSDDLETCLATLGDGVPVVVVDNSSDLAVEAVARAHGATYVDAGANLGFAGGVNLGIANTLPGADVLLLNPDAALTAEALSALHEHLRAPGQSADVAAVSAALRDPKTGVAQRVRWPFPTARGMWLEAAGLNRLRSARRTFCVGAVLLLRAEALREVGAFDERFFLYAEETDWQRRAVDRGWRVEEVAHAVALHTGAGSSTDLSRREVLFHAGTETYVRKWSGPFGWQAYRTAAVLGAVLRGLVLPGVRGAVARDRARLFLRGPRAAAALPWRCPPAGRRVTHVVVTSNFAGVERYVCDLARAQAAQGSVVTVIGGEPQRMRAELGSVRHRPGADLRTAIAQLSHVGRQDIVHAHMTAAELVAVTGSPFHRAPVVSTRHFAGPRGASTCARVLGRMLRRRLHAQISISDFVGGAVGEPTTVIQNSVQTQPDDDNGPRQPIVLCLQRLELEKATDVALRAWAQSGLSASGWQLHVAGEGAERAGLEELARELNIASSVHFLGHVTDTSRRVRQASLLLATATAEPFGLSVAEAMAMATPVVASAAGAHPELLGDKGWTFPPGDVKAAAARLDAAALSAEAERRCYGSYLQERQRSLFSLERHVATLDSLYRDVLSRGSSAAGRESPTREN